MNRNSLKLKFDFIQQINLNLIEKYHINKFKGKNMVWRKKQLKTDKKK